MGTPPASPQTKNSFYARTSCVILHHYRKQPGAVMSEIEIDGDIGRVPLCGGGVALIDACVAPLVGRYSWHLNSNGRGQPYARCSYRYGGVRRNKLMHRLLFHPMPGYIVDHINGNGLDNRAENIRFVTVRENALNKRGWSRCYPKGVSLNRGRFEARITRDHKTVRLGFFDTVEEAGEAYRRAAEELHGVFARYR